MMDEAEHSSSGDDESSYQPERKRIRRTDNGKQPEDRMPLTMAELLTVPPELVYRNVGSNNTSTSKPRALLTSAEAECFLRVALVAQELDLLLALAQEALGQQRFSRLYKQSLQQEKAHLPHLYPIISIVTLLEKQVKPELQHVKQQVAHLLSDLKAKAAILRQSAEQNWTMSDSLAQALHEEEEVDNAAVASGKLSLVQEKRRLADLEEELAQRIESVTAMSGRVDHSGPVQSSNHTTGESGDGGGLRQELFPDKDEHSSNSCSNNEPMADVAFELFHMEKPPPSPEEDTENEAAQNSAPDATLSATDSLPLAHTQLPDPKGTREYQATSI